MPCLSSPPLCEGLQTVGFSLNVTIRCTDLKYLLFTSQRIVLSRMLHLKFIKEPALAMDWVLKRQ